MTKLKIGFLVLFFVGASFIVAHVLYMNKFIWKESPIHILHQFDILARKVKGSGVHIVHGEVQTGVESSAINLYKSTFSGDKEVSELGKAASSGVTATVRAKIVEKDKLSEKDDKGSRNIKSIAKGSFKEWLKDATTSTRKSSNQIGRNTFDDDSNLATCPKGGRELVGLMYIDQTIPSMGELEKEMSVQHGGTVEKGGCWKPTDCKPRAKTAIVIPYRNREQQLKIFLRHLHPILQRQLIEYRIVVVEQAGQTPFNRAGLFNIGFKEALKLGDYNCFVFSDVDLLPEDDRNNYGCPTSPRHMSVAVDKFNYQLPYATIFGGVGAFTKEHFMKVNGFSNLFWGWGGEDDDLYNRITGRGFTLTRPSLKIGRYTMIKIHHFQSHGADPNRMELLKNSLSRMDKDGISSLRYHVKEFKELPLVTIVTVDIERMGKR